jgi:MFS family permease
MVRVRFGSVETTKTGIALLAVGLIGFALAPSEVVVLVALFVAGVGFLFAVTTTNSNLQRRLDESMRGRVMALWSMAFLGSRPIAGIIDGAVGDLVSPRVGVLTAAIPLLVGWWAMSRVEPHDGPRARRAAGSPEAESGR